MWHNLARFAKYPDLWRQDRHFSVFRAKHARGWRHGGQPSLSTSRKSADASEPKHNHQSNGLEMCPSISFPCPALKLAHASKAPTQELQEESTESKQLASHKRTLPFPLPFFPLSFPFPLPFPLSFPLPFPLSFPLPFPWPRTLGTIAMANEHHLHAKET